jgi:gamma-glutamyltranspeptidase/glutathione hydrolase
MKFKIAFLCIGLSLIACKKEPFSKRGTITKKAMVVSAREEASKIGSAILKQGGNAFDAMFATEMALAITCPYAGNLGGGGFMVYRLNTGEIGALDYREKAPLAASKNMYLDTLGNVIPNKSTVGACAVGVPGTIAGIFAAHEKFGTLSIEILLKPVIALAENGFTITEKQQNRFIKYDSIITAVNGKQTPINKTVTANSTFKNLALANTLKRISQFGRDEFYTGQTATQLVAFLNQHGGIMTSEDLVQYQAQ